MATLDQSAYRFYENADAIQPVTPYTTNEDRKIGAITGATVVRIRLGVTNSGTNLAASGKTFKLQYGVAGTGADSIIGDALSGITWTDIGAIGSGVIWRGFDNGTPTDGATVTTNLLSASTVTGAYVESGTGPSNPNAVNTNDVVEYDWVIQENGAAGGTYYVFRMVESGGTLLDSYGVYPRLATINSTLNHEQHQWAVVNDLEEVITGEDLTTFGISQNDTFRLRIMHKDGGSFITGGLFKVKYYNNYADMAADTNGTYIPDTATVEDWEWYDDGATDWWSHGTSVPTIVTSDHGPEPGVSLEQNVVQGDSYLLDWTAIGSNTGPEHNLSVKYVGTVSDVEYLFRLELDSIMMPISSMHYGANKNVMFVSGDAPPASAGGYSSDLVDIATDFADNTGWTALGGGQAGINAPETDYFNQGNNCISKNAWAGANKGMIYSAGATSIASGDALFMWITHLTPNSLDIEAGTPGGIQVLIGDGAGSYKGYDTRGSDTIKDGAPWICMVVDPTTTADDTIGTPTSATTFFGGTANLPVTGPTKGAPFGIDAFRYGRKFTCTGGDAISGATNFSGASAYNDDITRKYGQIQKIDGGYLMQGLFEMGTSTPTYFRDSNKTILINRTDKVSSDFNGFEINNSSSDIEWKNITVQSLSVNSPGYFNVIDNPPILLDTCVFTDMGDFKFWSRTSGDTTTWRRCGTLYLDYAKINNCTIDSANISSSGTSVIAQQTYNTQNTTFISSGVGHAFQITGFTQSIMSWNNYLEGYVAYPSTGSTGNEAIYVSSTGGTLNINVGAGYDPPSIRTDGAIVNVLVGQVETKITVLDVITGLPIEGARVYYEAASGGTISATTIMYNGVTDINGETSDIRGLITNQPIIGRVRRSTTGDLYKTSKILATIDNTTGLDLVIQMIPDE